MIQFNSFNPTPQTQVKLEIVFTLEPHAELGLIVQVKAVVRLASGNFSMNSEKVRISNSEFYGLSEKESKILQVIESYEPDNLLNLFYKGKKRINTSVFFEKIYTEDLKNNHVRPFIDSKIAEIFELLKGQTIYYWGTSTLNHWIPIVIEKNKADVEFLIERKPQGMSYSVNVFHDKNKIKVQGSNNIVVINTPACILLGSSVYTFKHGIDAKKIATFFTKSEIIVPETSEQVYLNKFIIPLVEEYNVKATGISIELETLKKEACLSFMYAQNDLLLDLTFTYGDLVYSFNTLSKGKAKLEKGKDWIIKFSKRDAEWEEEMIGLLSHLGFKISKDSHFSLPENLSIESFINDKVVYLQKKGFTINQDNLKQPFHLSEPVLTYTVREDNDWFDLNIIIRFGKFEIPFKKLRPHILNSNRFYELPDGSIAIIPQEWMQKLSPVLDCSSESNDNVRLGRFHYNLLESFDEIGINRSGEKMKSLVNAYKKASKLETPETVKAKLRKYQSTGLQWLVALNENKFGGLLADDMGLGKTVQTLAFFEWFILNKRPEYRTDFTQHPEMPAANGANPVEFSSKKKNIPFLVVAPTSLIHNWVDEIKKFTNLSHFIYMGNQRNRYVWEYFHDFEVILTTYGTIRNDKDVLSRVKFDAVVFDEAQNLKNPGSLTAKTCFDLNATQKLLLTGTPIENSTSDLWSLMNIANPGILGTYTKFVKNFSQKIEKKKDMKKVEELKELTAPFILRRTKEQVAKELPPRHEQVVYCGMESEQAKLYDKTKSYYRNELLKTIKEKGLEKSKLHVLKGLLKLRQMANHPILAQDDFTGESGKFNLIIENLTNIVERGNKVLLFSQFVSHLRLFKNKLNELGIKYAYIDGTIPSEDRSEQVKLFQNNPEYQVFLISLKAGGTGLNLTAADYVFLTDPWWNPAVERQAMDRAHRIGRNKPVFVYKYITEETVEEKIIKMQERKQKLASDLISEDGGSWLANIETEDIEEILK